MSRARLAGEITMRDGFAQDSLAEWIAERVERRGHRLAIEHLAGDVWLADGESDDLPRLQDDLAEWLDFYQGVLSYRLWLSAPPSPLGRRSRRSLLAV